MKNKIISFLREKNIEIPDNDNEIINLFLGALIVGKIDYWLERSFDFIDNEKPEKPFERDWSEVAKEDKAYRTSFAQLDSETKIQLKKLLRESIEGVIFSTLSELDKDWTINLNSEDFQGIANEGGELHLDMYKWIDLFGQNKESEAGE